MQDPVDLVKTFNEYFINSVAEIAQCFPNTHENLSPTLVNLWLQGQYRVVTDMYDVLKRLFKPSCICGRLGYSTQA